MKWCLISLTTREIQIKITIRQLLQWLKEKQMKKILIVPNSDKDTEKLEFSWTDDGDAKSYSHSGKQLGSF